MKAFVIPSNLKLRRSERLHLVINPMIKAMVFQRADEMNVSVGDYVNSLIGKDLSEMGRLPEVEVNKESSKKEASIG